MLKKICLLLAGASLVYAGEMLETFDWGTGVPGREMLAAGSAIRGVSLQSESGAWKDTGTVGSTFGGSAGPGNGILSMQGGNNAVGYEHSATGAFTVKTSGTFVAGEQVKGVRGFWLGLQSANPDAKLLCNQKKDHLLVQVDPTGNILFRAVVGGVTNTPDGKAARIKFKSGDLLTLALAVDLSAKTATMTVTGVGEGNEKVSMLSWGADQTPDWSTIMINQTGGGEVSLKSVTVSCP